MRDSDIHLCKSPGPGYKPGLWLGLRAPSLSPRLEVKMTNGQRPCLCQPYVSLTVQAGNQ